MHRSSRAARSRYGWIETCNGCTRLFSRARRNPQFTDAASQFRVCIRCLLPPTLRHSLSAVESWPRLCGLHCSAADVQTLDIRAIGVTGNGAAHAPILPQLLNKILAEGRFAGVSAIRADE